MSGRGRGRVRVRGTDEEETICDLFNSARRASLPKRGRGTARRGGGGRGRGRARSRSPPPGPSSRGNKEPRRNGNNNNGNGRSDDEVDSAPPPNNQNKNDNDKGVNKAKTYDPSLEAADCGIIHIPWVTELIPSRRPYFPQIGDDLIYFPQGHREYLSKVIAIEGFVPDPNEIQMLEDEGNSAFPNQRCACKLVGLDYEQNEVMGVSFAVVTLVKTNWETKDPLEDEEPFNLRFHHVDEIVDFLVLRTYYDASDKGFEVGERFRSLVEGYWWFGKVTKTSRLNGTFKMYQVKWDTGEDDIMSPWDIERIPPSQEHQSRIEEKIEPKHEELMKSLLLPSKWEKKDIPKILEMFTLISRFQEFEDFLIFPRAMNLTIIMDRIRNKFYRRQDAIKFDLDLMVDGVRSDAMLLQGVGDLRQISTKILDEVDTITELDLKQMMVQKSIDIKKEETSKEWHQECWKVLEEVMANKEAAPFKVTVDINTCPQYYEKVEDPITLQDIMEKFVDNEYSAIMEFHRDMHKVFGNAKIFFKRPSPTLGMAERLEQLYNSKMKQYKLL